MALPREFVEYKKKLQRLSKQTFPKVVAETLNDVAGIVNIKQKLNVKYRFELRNKYITNSMRMFKASPKENIAKIDSVVGTINPEMELHEKGKPRKPKRGKTASIPAIAARRGNRRYVVTKRYRAGADIPNSFVGVPKGRKRRAKGVYIRVGKKRLKMLRNIENPEIKIRKNTWHRDAVAQRATAGYITAAFILAAKRHLSTLG